MVGGRWCKGAYLRVKLKYWAVRYLDKPQRTAVPSREGCQEGNGQIEGNIQG